MEDKFNRVIENMYNVRSHVRSIYLNSSASVVSNLEDRILNEIHNTLKHKYLNADINISNFSISIELDPEASISNRVSQSVEVRIDNILREFIRNTADDHKISEYVSNMNNPIFDVYTIGNSIKFLL